jgi:hypothetical protein
MQINTQIYNNYLNVEIESNCETKDLGFHGVEEVRMLIKALQGAVDKMEGEASGDSFDASFIWELLRDAERGLNRCGIYAGVELGGVCHELQIAQDRMNQGDFSKARNMLKNFQKSNNNQ